MLDREGFRPNVGIVLLNARNEVFWGKRLREHSWQFPQGGIKFGETPVQAMYRELHEEVGLKPEHVKVIGRTRDWLRYEVPDKFIRREVRGHYRGQKQIWFLLRMVARDCDICLRATTHPEFDAWRWNSYWVPLDAVIEFKRDVYQLALTELSRFVRRAQARHDDAGADEHGAHDDHGDGCERHGAAQDTLHGSPHGHHAYDRGTVSSCVQHGASSCEPHDSASCDTHVLVSHAAVLTFTLSSASSGPAHADDDRPESIVPIAHK